MKKLPKKAVQLTKGAITIGSLGTLGGSFPVVGATLQPVSRALPIAGTVIGAGIALDALKDLEPKKRRKK